MRLKELRLELNLTQEELGKKIGQTKSNISKYENGALEPGIETLKLISKYFNVSLDYLLGEPNDPTPYSNVNVDLDSERDFAAELSEFIKDEDGLVAFKDFSSMNDESKKEIIQFIKFKKEQENNKE